MFAILFGENLLQPIVQPHVIYLVMDLLAPKMTYQTIDPVTCLTQVL